MRNVDMILRDLKDIQGKTCMTRSDIAEILSLNKSYIAQMEFRRSISKYTRLRFEYFIFMVRQALKSGQSISFLRLSNETRKAFEQRRAVLITRFKSTHNRFFAKLEALNTRGT